jgi:hypothetical protein
MVLQVLPTCQGSREGIPWVSHSLVTSLRGSLHSGLVCSYDYRGRWCVQTRQGRMRRRSAGRGSAKGLGIHVPADVRAVWRRHGEEVEGQVGVRQSLGKWTWAALMNHRRCLSFVDNDGARYVM